MTKKLTLLVASCLTLLVSVACTAERQDEQGITNNSVLETQEEIRAVIQSIKSDIESANIEGLQAIHLDSAKFTKFGPRSFDRQDVTSTNESEATFFSSISDANYEVRDLKVDVFGDVVIATYYPEVSFVKNGEVIEVSGRQTLVFLKTDSGWKLAHEHGTVRNQ